MEVFSLIGGVTDFSFLFKEGTNDIYNAICFSVIILRRLIKP